MAIIYKTDKEARKSLLSGVSQLAKLVTITMGPKGRNVAMDRMWAAPAIIHDGVSVAKEIQFTDPFENMGAELVKEAASKTVDKAGDGTTTAILLAWKLIEKGMFLIDKGYNPMMMKDGMWQATNTIVTQLAMSAHKIQKGDLENVATISAANAEIGKIIAEVIEHVGPDGVITVEEGTGQTTELEYKDGMMFDKGYDIPAFITNKDKQEAEIEAPMILFTDMVIDSLQDFSDFLGNIVTEKERNIVIIADSFQGETLSTLIYNHKEGNIRALALRAPSFGHKRNWLLEDMAILTGGTVITRQSGRLLSSIKREELGRADKVWADVNATRIIGGKGAPSAITKRIESLKVQAEKQESEFEKKGIIERIAKLSSGVAIIKVGALTETELKDRKERITDAVEATKAAASEGIIAGGGIALLQCLDSSLHSNDPDVQAGIDLVYAITAEPFKKIIANAGEDPKKIMDHLKEIALNEKMVTTQTFAWGYDIVAREYGNMFEMGVIDPLRVTRQALQNAVSVASMILTIEGLITKSPEDKVSPLEKNPPLT